MGGTYEIHVLQILLISVAIVMNGQRELGDPGDLGKREIPKTEGQMSCEVMAAEAPRAR